LIPALLVTVQNEAAPAVEMETLPGQQSGFLAGTWGRRVWSDSVSHGPIMKLRVCSLYQLCWN